ncbi:MAG: hypothetical protein JWN62_1597, partial [Acidimicrobiales bacterium]|nr:hypothetical protein [Acidimicrobiales bacterium]
AEDRRKIIDKVAAAVILQSWLDRRADQIARNTSVEDGGS